MCDCHGLGFICFHIDIFIRLLKSITVIEVLLLSYIFCLLSVLSDFSIIRSRISHIRSDSRGFTVRRIICTLYFFPYALLKSLNTCSSIYYPNYRLSDLGSVSIDWANQDSNVFKKIFLFPFYKCMKIWQIASDNIMYYHIGRYRHAVEFPGMHRWIYFARAMHTGNLNRIKLPFYV